MKKITLSFLLGASTLVHAGPMKEILSYDCQVNVLSFEEYKNMVLKRNPNVSQGEIKKAYKAMEQLMGEYGLSLQSKLSLQMIDSTDGDKFLSQALVGLDNNPAPFFAGTTEVDNNDIDANRNLKSASDPHNWWGGLTAYSSQFAMPGAPVSVLVESLTEQKAGLSSYNYHVMLLKTENAGVSTNAVCTRSIK